MECKTHPDAPHGFLRNASHTEGRYVCECEYWKEDMKTTMEMARVIDNGTPEGATEWIPFTNRVEPLKTGDLLYTTPPAQRTWVGLTDEEIQECYSEAYKIVQGRQLEIAFYKTIEAKLKEKNT